jgi:hypothetical protein
MYTVDFVDEKHLLVSFSTKRLLKRIAECPPTDQDRIVDAILLEVPSGKVLARTSWRMHDRGQYLWNLGQGRFMLRTRDVLTTFAPMVNLAQGNAFREKPFINSERRIGGVLLSPDADLMILETLEPLPLSPDSLQPTSGVSPEEQRIRLETPVQINFFRVSPSPGDDVGLRSGGAFRARVPGRIPANSAGYVSILDQGQQRWAFDFRSYSGKVKELSPFQSTCRPTPILVSRAEFISFGCHLSHTPQVVAGFNMRGEEMWEQNLSETYIAPTFAFAPKGGRFVLSRVLTHSSVVQTGDILMPELVAGQSIVVYQTDSGRQILKVDAAPVVRAGQNFALAPDGMTLALVQGSEIDLYNLPSLSAKEREAVKLAEASAPQDDGAPMQLGETPAESTSALQPSAAATPDPAATNASSSAAPEAAPPSTPESSSSAASAPEEKQDKQSAQNKPSADDQAPAESPRKPPTLYNEPGDKPGSANEQTDKPAPPKQ